MRTIDKLLTGEIKIERPDENIYKEVKAKWDSAGKPLDALGAFEEMTSRIGAILKDPSVNVEKKMIITMCGDNGVVEEGISQSGQDVTASVARIMGLNKSSVCKMATFAGIVVRPYDVGINSDEYLEGVRVKKVAYGTKNFVKEPAMTLDEVKAAIEVGIEAVKDAKEEGYTFLGTGEMGIGNTTTSSAVSAALLHCDPDIMVGKGSGLSSEGMKKKREVVKYAIEKYDLYNADTLEVLRCVGGFDIAGMAGIMIGGALYGIPVCVDGLISSVSALIATRLFPEVKDYLIASHMSNEPAAKIITEELGLDPVISARMALGEGTGCAMLMLMADQALTLLRDKLSFDDIRTGAYERFDKEEK